MDEPLPWQQRLWQQFQSCRAQQRLPHALLLNGRSGLGKLRFAYRMARALLCNKPTASGDACGCCRGCHLFEAGSHPDFSVVRSAEDSKVIKVDQVRELRHFLSLTSHYGSYKVVVIEAADTLNINAANSLLKTLEEPPGDCLLLLVSSQATRLPATIRSRCQVLHFDPPPTAESINWLASRIAKTVEPQTVLEIAVGAPLAALALADERCWNRRSQLLVSYERLLMRKTDPIQLVEFWLQGPLLENLQWLIGWHTDLIRLKMSPEPPWLSNPDLGATLRRWGHLLTARILFERLDAVMRLYALCSTTQANPQLLLEVFFSDSVASSGLDVSAVSL